MRRRTWGVLLTIAIGGMLPSLASAQQRPTVAITPTQYFSADAESAANISQALVEVFTSQGYTVIPLARSQAAFAAAGLEDQRDIGDPTLIPFGRGIGADLVVHAQLLAAGLPGAVSAGTAAASLPRAVLYLRVLNTHTGKSLYTRQIRYEFNGTLSDMGSSSVRTASVPPAVAKGAANEVSRLYFERVAGSRQEIGRPQR